MKKVIKVKVESIRDKDTHEQTRYIEIRKSLNGHVDIHLAADPAFATVYNYTKDAIIDASKYYDEIREEIFTNYDLLDISIGEISVTDTFDETSIKSLLES